MVLVVWFNKQRALSNRSSMKEKKLKKFEQRLARLEELSEKITNTDLPLEDALAAFEEGIKLAKSLEKDIEKIESKVQILVNQPVQPEDKPELELFSPEDIS